MGLTAGMMGNIGLGAQAAGGAAGAVGSYFSAKSKRLQLEGAAAMQDLNAQQTELAAQQEFARGDAQVAQVTRRAGQVKGAQRTALAANGVVLGEGNAAELVASTDILKEEDVNTITGNAIRAAWGQRIVATNQRNDANAKRAGADSISPLMAGATSLLGSASQVASSWYNMNKAGVSAKGS